MTQNSQRPPRSRPGLLLVGSGSAARNTRLLSGLSAVADIALLQADPVSWQRPYVRCAAEIAQMDVCAALAAARPMIADLGIQAVTSYDEGLVVLASELAHRLGLPGVPRAAAAVVRDKFAQRRALATGPVAPTQFELVDDVVSAQTAAGRLGYPVIIKPRSLSGSLGVSVAAGPAELRRLFPLAISTDSRGMDNLPGVLIEELLDGPEFSVDCWVLGGHAAPLLTARIFKGYPPHAINVGCVVGPGVAEPEVVAAVESAACDAALACGLDRTIANVDLRWIGGEPRVLEVNGRPGGEQLPELALLSRGLCIGSAFGAVALGRRPRRRPAARCAAGVAFVAPRVPIIFGGLDVPSQLTDADWLVNVQTIAQVSQPLTPPPDDPWGRAGSVMVSGASAREVIDRLHAVWSQVEVVGVSRRRGAESPT